MLKAIRDRYYLNSLYPFQGNVFFIQSLVYGTPKPDEVGYTLPLFCFRRFWPFLDGVGDMLPYSQT